MTDESPLLRAVLDAMPESVAVYDLSGAFRYVNPATERLLGMTLAEMRGRRVWDVLPEAVGSPFHAAFQRVAAGGPEETFDLYHPPFERWFTNRVVRVGELVHVVAREVTEEVRRRRRLEALARISEVLTTDELPHGAVAQAFAQALTEVLQADCSLALLSADRDWLEIVAAASPDPEVLAMTGVISRVRADAGHPGEALRTRAPVLAQQLSVSQAVAETSDEVLREVLGRYRPASVLIAPLLVGDDALGVLIVVRRQGAPPLTADDRGLVTEIAPGVALYVAHARRTAEAASLRHRLSAITDASPALISFIDGDRRYQYVNAGYTRWFGRPAQEIIGRPMAEVLGPAATLAIEPYVQQVLAGSPVHFRTRLDYPQGPRHVDGRYLPAYNERGEVEGFTVLVLDVTAETLLVEAEQQRHLEARRATERLESLLAVTSQLAGADNAEQIARVVVDEGARAIEASMVALWLLAPSGEELVLLRHHGFAPAHAAAFQRVALGSASPLVDAVSGGRPVWVESLAFAALPLVSEGRATGCVSFTFHDERRLTSDERTYLEMLASHAAEALRRARLYAELRDTNETQQAMIRSSPAAILLLDEAGTVHAWNPGAERVYGWTAQEALGRFLPSVGEDREELLAHIRHVLEGHVVSGKEVCRVRKDGEWFDAALYAAPVRLSDGRTLCLSMGLDISERKRIERGRQLIGEAGAVLGRTLERDQALGEFVRLAVRQFADRCAIDLRHDGELHRLAEAEAELAGWELRSSLSAPLGVADRVFGELSFGSTRRAFDEVDLAIARELASHVSTALENARLYQEARAARREAEAANRSKDEFLAILGHELRNPLAPIVTALHLMKLRAPGQLGQERAVLERQVAHLTRLIDDLLDISRITRGKIELHRERLLLSGVVARAVELVSPLLEQQRHQLSVEIDPALAVLGDATRLSQVVQNLLDNAAKYTGGGGHIEIRAERQGEQAVLVVRDDGMGIDPEVLPSIFESFVQAPQGSARSTGGLGLGLAIVRSLVELHGGTVRALSGGLGQGTELTVTLPVAPEPAPELTTPAPAPPPRGLARRILVVDDNEDAADLLAAALDAQGHQTRIAYDGPSALRIAEDFRPEVAVLDIGLPVMDGYELAQRLRKSQAALRLIAVTGYGQQTDRARSREAGFDEHLTKPVALETLVELVALRLPPSARRIADG
jgi:PAS domain S-box-containing protein